MTATTEANQRAGTGSSHSLEFSSNQRGITTAAEREGRVSRKKPRHRKNGQRAQASCPTFHIGQDRSVTVGAKKTAITAALAVGVIAVGGSVAGGIDAPGQPDPSRAGGCLLYTSPSPRDRS